MCTNLTCGAELALLPLIGLAWVYVRTLVCRCKKGMSCRKQS
jgi:hypothetical protein